MILKRKKNWDSVELKRVRSGYILNMDGNSLKTPGGNICTIKDLYLANKVYKEWSKLEDEIDYKKMPYTRTCFLTLDRSQNESITLRKKLVGYGMSDLFCYRAEKGSDLAEIQGESWTPLIGWVQTELQATLQITNSIMPITQSIEVEKGWIKLLQPVQSFTLTALDELVTLSSSLIIGICLLKGKVSPEKAWKLIRIDEDWQRAKWGTLKEHKKEDQLIKTFFMHSSTILALDKK
tara:strand:- start:73 stop:780 length:708 start_codon:yes stop_codon:yes gene_type:complete